MSFASVSRWSDVAIAALAQFAGALGTFLVMVTLVLAVQRAGAGGVEVALLALAEALPMVLLGAVIGRVVDRFDSRRLLVAAGVGQVLACVALAAVTAFPAVVAGAAALSLASGLAAPTRQALTPAMVRRDDLPRASAIGQTAGSVGMMLGPALAGLLVGTYGPQQTVRLAAVVFAATIVAALLIRTRRAPDPGAPADPGTRPVRWALREDRLLWSSVWGVTAVITTISAVNVVLVFFILRTLHGSEQVYGIVDSMWTLGVLVGAWAYSLVVRPSTGDGSIARWVFLALGLLAGAILLVGSAPAPLWIIPCYLLGGAQNGGLNVLVGTLAGRRVPAHARGRASAALAMRVQAGAMVGYVAGGALLQVAAPRTIVLGCGLLGLAAAAGVLPLVARAARHAGAVVSTSEPGQPEPMPAAA